MKRFVLEILLFGLLAFGVLVAGEMYVRHLPNPARDKHEWMLNHSNEVETLVLGSSHTFYGVVPEILGENAYSLAMVSQTYRYDNWLLKNYDMPRLKTIILPFSYFSLYEDYEKGIGEDYISRYRIYMNCSLHSAWSKYNFEFMDFSSFKEKLKSLYKPQQMTWDERGWGSNYTLQSRPEQWDNGANRALVNTCQDTVALNLNRSFLEDIFLWARTRHVQVILVSTPLSEGYRKSMDGQQVARNRRVLNGVLRKYPEVVYLDCSEDLAFVEEDFYDADHLTDLGARKLTRKLLHVLPDIAVR